MKYIVLSSRPYYYLLTILFIFTFSNCKWWDDTITVEIDIKKLEKIYSSSVSPSTTLNKDIDLYVDYSTCVIDAVKNSSFFKSLRPTITGESPTLYAIKGPAIQLVSSDMDTVNRELTNLTEIAYADITGAIGNITNSNKQSILITDGEFWTIPEGERTDLPYMRESFEKWINRGYVVHIVIENYKESYKGKSTDKKRFYFFFTDDKLENNIYEIARNSQGFNSTDLNHFKMSNSDINIIRNTTIDDNLQFKIDTIQKFDFIEIDSPWEDIQNYVLNASDDEENPIKNGSPLIKDLKISNKTLVNFDLSEISIKAYNITDFYLDSNTSKIKVISEGFILDKTLFKKKGEIAIRINDKLFNQLETDQKNVLRIDIVLEEIKSKPIDKNWFTWKSLSTPNVDNISVFESIKQTFDNPDINPKNRSNGIIHTIFIKTLEYN